MPTATEMHTQFARINLEWVDQLQISISVFKDNCEQMRSCLTKEGYDATLEHVAQINEILEARRRQLLALKPFNPATVCVLNATPGIDARYDKFKT